MPASVARRAPARQWQECHGAIDSRHASRGGPGAGRRGRLRPLDPGAGLRQRARALRVHGLRRARRARAHDDRLRARRPARARRARRRRHRPRPRAAPRAVAAAGGRARGAARRARTRRARGLDLHRRLRPRRTPACSTAAARRRTGPTPSGWPSAIPRSPSTPTSSTSTRATSSPPPASRPASTCACTSCAATTAPRWPTPSRGGSSCAPHRDGGQAQFVEAPVPVADGHGLEPTRAWATSACTSR